MPVISSTTARRLQADIVSAIQGLTPSEEHYREWSWTHSADNRSIAPSRNCRMFEIGWIPGSGVVGGLTGNNDYTVEAEVVVVTHYRSIPDREVGWLVTNDHADLVRLLSSRLANGANGIDGLMGVEAGAVLPGEGSLWELGISIEYLKSRST